MFIILPVGVDYRARRYPVVTFTLMGICTAVYLITLVLEISYGAKPIDKWVFNNLWLIPNLSHWWTYLTYQFVHEGFFHLAGNMVYLFLFGSCVEDMIGRFRFTIFYLTSGVAAALAYVLLSPENFAAHIPMGGASGAISACIGGFLLLLAKTKIEFKWVFLFFFRFFNGEFMLPAWLVISFWFLEDFGMMILAALGDGKGGGVAFGAHVGGTLFGMAWLAIERPGLKRRGAFEEEFEQPVAARVRPILQPRVRQHTEAKTFEIPTLHLFSNGAQSGPFTRGRIKEMFATGEISLDALYWKEGMGDWRTIEDLLESDKT